MHPLTHTQKRTHTNIHVNTPAHTYTNTDTHTCIPNPPARHVDTDRHVHTHTKRTHTQTHRHTYLHTKAPCTPYRHRQATESLVDKCGCQPTMLHLKAEETAYQRETLSFTISEWSTKLIPCTVYQSAALHLHHHSSPEKGPVLVPCSVPEWSTVHPPNQSAALHYHHARKGHE